MKKKYTALFALGLLMVAFLVALSVSILLALSTPLDLHNGVLRVVMVVLLGFLAVLVLRYVLLLWLAYLQHVEYRQPQPADGRPEALPPISIIVPAYNEEPVIEGAIRSLLQQDYPRFEVLVVDDGSTDATYQKASALEGVYCGASVRVVSKVNGGKAAALNTGITMARYPFVLCMDGDSRLSPQTLRNMVRHFQNPRVAAVAGNVKVINRVNPLTRLQALEYIQGLNMPRRAQSFMRAVNIIPGPIGIFRRDVLVQLGGYERDTFAEDADLTLKILAAGWQIEYEEKAIAYTEAPENLHALIKQRYRWTRGILQALAKRKGMLVKHHKGTAVRFSTSLLLFESLIWPFLNVVSALLFALVTLSVGFSPYLIGWVLLLTLLDVAAALYSVAIEGEDLSLVPLAVIYRFSFILLIDVVKLFATIEEALKLDMSWGKLERLGRI